MGATRNKKINKFIKITASCFAFLALAVFLLVPVAVLAGDGSFGFEYASDIGLGTADIRLTAVRIVRIFLGLLGIIAVIIIIYGGYVWMTSAGSSERVERAKAILRNAIIGLVIILMSLAIVQFIINRLMDALGQPNPPTPAVGELTSFGGGALGDGPIRSVYPVPLQRGVPRNTLIMITFKQEILPCSIAEDSDANGTCADDDLTGGIDYLNPVTTPIKIYKQVDGEAMALAWNEVSVYTSDNKTFVFDPVPLLGSDSRWFWYDTKITADVMHEGSGESIFSGFYQQSYTWSYEVSNIIDITPPQESFHFPWNDPIPWPRNAVIRVDFNEAMNAISVSGTTQGDDTSGNGLFELSEIVAGTFDRLMVYDTTNLTYIMGKWVIGNNYRTAEFYPEAECEGEVTNSCGDQVYCLPGNATLRVTVLPAPLTDCAEGYGSPILGATDAAANSLDGDKNWMSDGCDVGDPTTCNQDDGCGGGDDKFRWEFKTSNVIDLNAPTIEGILQYDRNNTEIKFPPTSLTTRPSNISLTAPIRMTFSKLMLAEYLRTDGKYGDGRDYIYLSHPTSPVGYYIESSSGDGCSRNCLNEGALAGGSTCGDGFVTNGEDCDILNNIIDGDGCSSDCLHEGNAVCGNGIVERGEDCDGGAGCYGPADIVPCTRTGNADSCPASATGTDCCGNGRIDYDFGEECDDGDTVTGDGCDDLCMFEGSGWSASVNCGNGIIEYGEECEDRNTEINDGCDANCLHEGSFCGDGTVDLFRFEECEPSLSPECAWNCLWLGTTPVFEGGTCGNNPPLDPGEECDDGQTGLQYQKSKVYIEHGALTEGLDYGVLAGSGIRDAFQNCYYPAVGPDCTPPNSPPDCILP